MSEPPHLTKPVVIDTLRLCAGVLPLTSGVREHVTHPTPQAAHEAVRSQVEAAVKHDYGMALMDIERQKQCAMMQNEGFDPQSPGDILKTLALAYGIWIRQDGLSPVYDLFKVADQQPGILDPAYDRLVPGPLMCGFKPLSDVKFSRMEVVMTR